jgi:hypothetical protein
MSGMPMKANFCRSASSSSLFSGGAAITCTMYVQWGTTKLRYKKKILILLLKNAHTKIYKQNKFGEHE